MSSNIPDIEFELIMGKVLDIESLGGGDGADILDQISCTSLESDLRMVVLPALSSPSTRILSYSFLFLRRFLRMPISPPPWLSAFIFSILNIYSSYHLSILNIIPNILLDLPSTRIINKIYRFRCWFHFYYPPPIINYHSLFDSLLISAFC